MSHIISLLPRHFIGTAAEIAGITGVCGDTAYSSDTDVYYHWNGLTWGVGGISFYEPLDCAAPYKSLGDFTVDAAWHVDGLDLSGLLPVGTIAVNLRFLYCSGAAGNIGRFRQNATTNVESMLQAYLQAANKHVEKGRLIGIDSDRLLDYFINVGATTASLFVLGYVIRRCL
ncbi:hypothetical protein ES703_32963 [subsurface metagenome]